MESAARRVARFRERFAQAINLRSTDSAQGTTVYNNNAIVNVVSGDGNIINNYNPVTNVFGSETDSIQAKITAALHLRYVPMAVYNAQLSSGCMEGTRVQILRDIEIWVKNPKAPQIYWLAGMAGTGKTAIAWTICWLASTNSKIMLGGSFFCSRSSGQAAQRDVRCVVPTLAQLLARQSAQFAEALAEELDRDPDVLQKHVGAQVEQLLYKPLLSLQKSRVPIIFVIDALDECSDQRTVGNVANDADSHRIVSDMLEALVAFSRFPVKLPVKFLITSRPETHIRDTPVSDAEFSTILRLHTVDKDQVSADIRLYIDRRLSKHPQLRTRIPESDIERLARSCDGLFIVAATALQHALGAGSDKAAMRFQTLLNDSQSSLNIGVAAPLDRMYAYILTEAVNVDEPAADTLPDLLRVLAALLSAQMTLSLSALADLLDRPTEQLRGQISHLHAVLHVPDQDDEAGLRTVHASFGDYLFSRAPPDHRIPKLSGHEDLARMCFRVMRQRLHFNVSQSRSSYESNASTRPASITLSLEYACMQWIYHLSALGSSPLLEREIDDIFRPRFLFWLEVMSVVGQVWRAAKMLFIAAAMVQSTELSEFLRDANIFVTSSHDAIERSAPHIYISALPFSSKTSLVYSTFAGLCTGLVSVETFGIDRHGGNLLMTLTGHEDTVFSAVYSPDGLLLASCSRDGTAHIWDTRTGYEAMSPLRSGDGSVRSIVFAPNGDSLATGCDSGVIHLWSPLDSQTTPRPLCGHHGRVNSVRFSPDSSMVASASFDTTVRLWSSHSGEQVSVLSGHTAEVSSVTFSSDGEILASSSFDKTIRLWRVNANQTVCTTMRGHKEGVDAVVFLPDGTRLASCSRDNTIRLWDIQTGKSVVKLSVEQYSSNSIQISPDGQVLVSGSSDGTICLWNLQEDAVSSVPTVVGRHLSVNSVCFSPDGRYIASTSKSDTRIWNCNSGQRAVQPLPAHDGTAQSITVSKDGTFIVSGSRDRSVRVWNAQTGQAMFVPLIGHTNLVRSVSVSSDGQVIASASNDRTVRLWNAQTGDAFAEPLRGHQKPILAVAFLSNTPRLASWSLDHTLRIWDAATGQPEIVRPLACSEVVISVAFSSDGRLLAAGCDGGQIYVWWIETGQPVRKPLKAGSVAISSISFSPDGTNIAFGGSKCAVDILDIRTGKQACLLTNRPPSAWSIAYSPDGRLIAVGCGDRALRVWNSTTGMLIAMFHGRGVPISIAFMPDGQSIVACSSETSIRVWDVEAAQNVLSKRPSDLLTTAVSSGIKFGWVMSPLDELLLWIPSDYRNHLQLPSCKVMISRYRIIVTANSSWCHGESWTACWRGAVRSTTAHPL